jgi:6-phosphofructokinase 1
MPELERSRRYLIPEEDLGLDRLLESLKSKGPEIISIVVIAEGDKIGKNVFEGLR